MLIYFDEQSGKALLELLNTEDAFGTLDRCLKRTIKDVKQGLKDYGKPRQS